MYDLIFAVHKLPRQSIVIPRKILVIDFFRQINLFMRDLDLIAIHLYEFKSVKFQDGKTSGVHLVKIRPLQSSFRHKQLPIYCSAGGPTCFFSFDKSD